MINLRNLVRCSKTKLQHAILLHSICVTAPVDNNEILSLYFVPVFPACLDARWRGRGGGVQTKLNLMFTLSMISSSRTYLTWPLCLPIPSSMPICFPFFFFFSFYHLLHISKSVLVFYNILFLSPDLVDPYKIIRIFRRARFHTHRQHCSRSTVVPGINVYLTSLYRIPWRLVCK